MSALQSFLTSYLIGCKDQKIISNSIALTSASEILVLHKKFYIPLLNKSVTGFHTFSNSIYLKDERDFNHFIELSFEEFITDICRIEDANENDSLVFKKRVLASRDKIENLEGEKEHLLDAILSLRDLSFQSTEQALIYGHFSHPYPKLQEHGSDFTTLENSLNLKWFEIDSSIIHVEHSKRISKDDIYFHLLKMYQTENASDISIGKGRYPVPVHPLQIKELFSDPIINRYLKDGLIQALPEKKVDCQWIPTTSMRTLYNEKMEWMLKFSLGIRLTNSIRTLQENEVKRGIQLHEVFKTSDDQLFLNDHDLSTLHILHEPVFISLKDDNQKIIKNSIVVLRENIFKENPEQTICLATLNQQFPPHQVPLLVKIIEQISINENELYESVSKKWFEAFLTKAICPFVILQARYGIYLGAHQQNLILKLDSHHYPEKGFYRDCQGTGYSEYGYEKFKHEVQSLLTSNGNILPVDFANTLMGYYLFINSVLYTIKTIAQGQKSIELSLIQIFTEKIQALSHLNDYSFVNYVLNSPTFLIKDNFECCLKGINENTMENPLNIYKKFINPFYQEKL